MAWHPFRNFGLKALALALATMMWMTVTRDQLVERSLRVPVEYRNIPESLEIIGETPGTVDVRVRGASSLLGRLAAGDVVAVLDLRGARAGERIFHLLTDEVRAPFGIEVAQISPATVTLTFEPSGSRVVPVVPAIDGTPANGYVVERVTVEPPRVEVVGPESRLQALKGASTEPVSVDNATWTVTDTVTVGVADAALRLRVPRSAKVTVAIVPAPIERAVYDVPVRVRNLRSGRRSEVLPPSVTVVLQGGRAALDAVEASTLDVWVDATGLGPGRYSLQVQRTPGQGLTTVRTDPDTVKVQVR